MKKIVENFTVVKPRTERVHFHGKGTTQEPEKINKAAMDKYQKTRHDSTCPATKDVIESEKQKEPLQKNIKWKDKIKLDALAEEKKAVGELIKW